MMKCLVLLLLCVSTILSSPAPLRRDGKSSSCMPNVCITEPAFCLCGFEASPDDLCCDYKCSGCPPGFTLPWMTFEIGPLNFFPLGALNLSGLDWPLLGRR